MKSRIILFFCTFLLANIHTSSADCTPSQIHLSFGDNYYSTNGSTNAASSSSLLNNNQAYLVWQSTELCQYTVKVVDAQTQNVVLNKTVDYTGNFSYNVTGETESQNSTVTLTSYTVLLQNLSYQTKYVYTILDQTNTPISESFPFTLASPTITTVPSKILVVGNFGTQQPQNMTLEAIDELLNENDTYAGMIQIGQVPQSDNATIQTAYINTLPNFTAVYPILMTPTKGDLANNSSFFDFRIRNPLLNVTQNQYFSFNLQGIHFVSINFDYYNALDEAAKNQTYSWIENDLNVANSNASRESAPFIVVISSDPIYCIQENYSNAANCSNFYGQNENWTELFSNYSVDLVISGTMEAYQTLLPVDQNSSYVVDPSSPAYIIEGVGSSFVGAGFGVLYTQNNEFDRRLIYEHFVSDTGDNITALNLIKIKPQSDSNLPNNTQNNNGSNTQGNGEEELVGPSVNPNADATSSDIAADPDTSEPIFTRIIIPCIIILAIVAGAYYWKRRKAADPEMERLSVQEYKSNKIYNKRSTDASISMVDLVL